MIVEDEYEYENEYDMMQCPLMVPVLVVVLVLAAGMQHSLVVEELDVAFLEHHRQSEFRALGDVLGKIKRLPLDVGERQMLAPA